MYAPYTDHPAVTFQAAQIATGALLGVVGIRPLLERGIGVCAVWTLSVVLATASPFLGSGALHVVLGLAAVLLLVAPAATRRRQHVVWCAPWIVLLLVANRWLLDFDMELAAAHLAVAGFELGLLAPARSQTPASTDALAPRHAWQKPWVHDLLLFAASTLAAACVSHFVMLRSEDGSDETAYAYQAAVYAKGRLYGETPTCLDALRNYWILWKDERMFAQYQPGWPLFLVPFVWADAIWLGGPVSFGLLCVAVARLARRTLGALPSIAPHAVVRGGIVAGGATMLGTMLLVNGGSRFPHLFVAALFAFAVELTWLLSKTTAPRAAARLGLGLGTVLGLLLLVRVPDTVMLSLGPVLVLGVALYRRKSHPVGAAMIALAAVPWAALLLWTARVQVGRWGVLPYQMTHEIYPWLTIDFSPPKAHLWKWSVPLATGAYCWWPLGPALGMAGLVLLIRSRALRSMAAMLGVSGLAVFLFYGLLELGRGGDFGYGPRYTLVLVVPMAVGTAVMLEHALAPPPRRSRGQWPWALASGIALVGAAVIANDVFTSLHQTLLAVSGPERAATAAGLQNAIVLVPEGVTPYGPTNVTRNGPIELTQPAVIYANDLDVACLRREYPNRTLMRAEGSGEVRFVPVLP